MLNLEFPTKYGLLKGLKKYSLYPEGTLNECVLDESIELSTPYGSFVPQYGEDNFRRKHATSLCFFKNGNLKSISLQDETKVATSIGDIPSEYITFYESGNLRRIFPLNGKLSEYWSEEDEFELAKNISFDFPFASFSRKIIGIQFYESGKIRSITLWPKENIEVSTNYGVISTRIGLALYESGAIKSLEPKVPTTIKTPIGKIVAYDINTIGVNGDVNSLCFTEEGVLKSLLTYSNKVRVVTASGERITYGPTIGQSLVYDSFDDLEDMLPLKIEFSENSVIFNSKDKYNISETSFFISKLVTNSNSKCSSCASCNSNCC